MSLIHLNFNFVQGDKYGSICIFLPEDIQLVQLHLLKMLFTIVWFGFFVKKKKNQVFIGLWVNFFSSIALTGLPAFMWISYSFYYYWSVLQLEIRDGDVCVCEREKETESRSIKKVENTSKLLVTIVSSIIL